MAHKAYHRMRRNGFLSGDFGTWLKGLLLSIGATVLMVTLFALIVGLTDVGDGTIRVVNQLIKLAAILLGVRFAVSRGADHGALRGALLGLVYMGAGVVVYALMTGQQLTFTAYLMDVLIGVSVGGLYGMLRGSSAPRTNKAAV